MKNFKKGQLVEIEKTEDNLWRFVQNEDGKIIGRVVKNKGWSYGNYVKDPVDVQVKKRVGKSPESIFAITRSELTLV